MSMSANINEELLFPWTSVGGIPVRRHHQEGNFEKRISFDMCRWTSVLADLVDGQDPDKIRQKMGISKIQFREIRAKLRRLAVNLGYDLVPGDE